MKNKIFAWVRSLEVIIKAENFGKGNLFDKIIGSTCSVRERGPKPVKVVKGLLGLE